ncbi:MAG: tetratricopeptide repeat protein [Chloroflexota bacterium]
MNETSQQLRETIDTFIQTAQFDALLDTCRMALRDARERGDRPSEILALIGLAQVHEYIGKFKEARVLIDGTLDFAAQAGDAELETMALIVSGTIFVRAAYQPYEAEQDFRVALRIADDYGELRLVAEALNGLSRAYLQMGTHGRAQRYARQGFEVARGIGDRYQMGKALYFVGEAASLNEPEKALQAFEDAMEIAQQNNFRLLEVALVGSIGALLSAEERYADDGQLMLEKGLAMAKDFRSVPHEFAALRRLGITYQRQQAYDRSAQYFGLALERAQEWRAQSYEGAAFYALGVLAQIREHYDDAIANFEQTLLITKQTKNPFQEAQTERALGDCYLAQKNFDEALDHFMASRTLYDALDSTTMTNMLFQKIVGVYIQRLVDQVLRLIGLREPSDRVQ